jgi:hypothetical protein
MAKYKENPTALDLEKSPIPQPGMIKGYDTNAGGKEVYVNPGVYVPGVSATPWTPPKVVEKRTPKYDANGNEIKLPSGVTPVSNKEDWTKQNTPVVDDNKIREDLIKAQQARIDAINKLYDEQLASAMTAEKQTSQEMSGRSRAIASRRGLIGSDFGSAQLENTRLANVAREEAKAAEIGARRNAEIQSIYGEVDKMAQQKAIAEYERQKGNQTAYMDYLKTEADKAKGLFSAAGSGSFTNYNDFKDKYIADYGEEAYRTLLNNAKITDVEAEAYFNAGKPKADYQNVSPGQTIIDQRTGKVIYTAPPKEDYTGIVQEYEYYKKQEQAAGRTPKSFTEYQNEDANRKRRIASAGLSGEEKEIQKFQSDAAEIIMKLDDPDPTKRISWGSAYDSLKAKYPKAAPETINAILGGGVNFNPATGQFDFSSAWGRAKR